MSAVLIIPQTLNIYREMLKSFSVIAIFICVANSVFASEKCGKNEKPTSCFESMCERRSCSDLDKSIRCVRIDPNFCTEGCLCEDTYLRAENGTCIPANQCSNNNQCDENEVYDICPPKFPGDECNGDTELNTCLSNPEPGDPECQPGCRCIDNYKRNENGFCVPEEHCLQCNGQNEISSCKSCAPQTCESIGKIYHCPLQPAKCKPECRCKNGYYRNKIGDCISEENCLKCNGPNEFFSCGGACDNVCATLGEQNQTYCPIVNIKCNEMCYCEEGYARDSNNICVPISQCPQLQCYGQNEILGCQRACPPDTCETSGEIYNCPLQPLTCKPACRCKNGYYRNKLGECISKEDCLKCTGPNEYYSCGGACDNVCATLNEQNQTNCPIVNIKCNEMCYCEEGYARDSNNICVPISQCPQLQCYGQNEEIGCQTSCPPDTCDSIGKIYNCPLQPLVCKPACRCKNGYYRNKLGECISKEDCSACGINEVYDLCPATCPPRTCDALTKAYKCKPPPQYGDPDCKPGCRCADNYYKNKKGVCVPKDQCPKPPGVICGADEVYSSCVNGGCGRWNCSQPGIICIHLIEGACREGCHCKEGLLRADNGSCIPANQCPLQCYGQNEVSGCKRSCPPETCDSIGKNYFCPRQPVECVPECRCQKGYYRNKLGECISKEDCLRCTGPNEYYSCGGACDNVCATLNEQNQTNCLIVNIKCNEMCYCEEGYARDSNNICVPISQCPQLQCYGQNEEIGCQTSCPPDTCDSIGKIYNCPLQPLVCKPACRCKNGFYRNKLGECISKEDCSTCGINEVYDLCPATCPPRTCDALTRAYKCKPPPQYGDPDCKPGCRCADNYYRNKKGVCVPKDQCPKPPGVICGADEVYTSCVNGGCGRWNCSQPGIICIDLIGGACREGCHCKEGLLRADNGSCIPANQCPLQCHGQNEVSGCKRSCPPETCDSIGKHYFCPRQPVECVPECRCQKGYYRNKLGECISKEDCLRCTGPNEYYSCGGACDNVCATLSEQNQTNCPIVNIKCNEMCYCEEGYARDSNNICVPISQCPQLQCYGPNEEIGCQTSCPPDTCDSIGKIYNCPLQPLVCKPACRCKNGFYRNKLGECISKEDCSTCGINEVYDLCPASCPPRTCDALTRAYKCKPPPQYGDPDCKPGCRCADNYYRNKKGVCVPKDQCPKPPGVICGADEVYTSCVNGGCGRWNCSQPGIICIDLIEGACREGCHCKEGLLRADNGSCIPANQCPLQCYGQNEVSGCKRSCPPETCDSIGKNYFCPRQPVECVPECRCQKGYYRNKLGECISKEDCLRCNGLNEYYSCGGACDNVCATLSEQNQTNCPIINIKCNEMCYCKEGYARDSNNICVPISECIEPVCGTNEIYDRCPATCPPETCDSIEQAKLILCAVAPKYGDPNCQPRCRCIDNYYRNKEGICIPKDQCPKPPGVICGPNEVYSSCANGGCGRWKCSQPGIICIDLIEGGCEEGCRCEDGLLRANNGSCIPADQCPLNCFGLNEVSGCKQTCPPDTCESIGKIYHCPLQPANCEPECRCKKGYFRNKIGECISKDDCLKCSGPNEYFACDGACDNVCATLSERNKTYCPIVNKKCTKMCYCEDGYARDVNNICVPISKCPQPTCGKNEIYDVCPATCPPRTCDGIKLAEVIRCKAPPKYGDPDCRPGCTCIDNYYRNKDGVCVPKDQCPKPPGVICGADEVYSSCVNGGCGRWNCSQPAIICIDLIEGACREGCHCKDGLLRADNGSCIPADQCPLNCHGINEVSGCHITCPPQTCESIGKVYPCPLQLGDCRQECRCKENYYRNKLGVCISKKDCLKCTGPHEYFSCGGACDNVCTTLSEQNQTHCPIVNIQCNRRCYCEKGYARNCNNTCVPISECPNLNCDGQNEITGCLTTCPPQTCESIGKLYSCPAQPVGTVPECRCKKDYYRNKAGDCISKADCLKCTGPNEYFSTDGTCDQFCETSTEPDETEFSTDVAECYNICRCEEGYARDSNNKCVPTSQCEQSDDNGLEEFEKGNIEFTASCLKIVAYKNPGVSFIFSAFSVLLLLTQLTLYAYGPALQELLHLLNLDNKNQIRSFVPEYLDTLKCQRNVTLDLAERMYIGSDYKILESVLEDTKKIFDAEAQNVDFRDQTKAAKIINDWVLNKTNNLIPNLVSPSSLDRYTVLVLVNAIYFKGDWQNKFDPKKTMQQQFYINQYKNVTVNMMRQTKSFKYMETKTIQSIMLPYKNNNISMLILLPKNKDGLNEIHDGLADGSLTLSNIMKDMNYAEVDISLPKIHTTTTTDLKDLLQKDNIKTIFNCNASGLNITKNNQPVCVSSALQKAYIEVNEIGSEAAAANAIVLGARSVVSKQTTEFIANHPFIYYILYKEIPVFCGIYYGNIE